jgi:hypothetical protein
MPKQSWVYAAIAAGVAMLTLMTRSHAQPAQYAAPDETTWNQMVKALDGVPASGEAHTQINSILGQVQQIAQRNKMQADAAAAAAKKASDEAALKAAGTDKKIEQIATPKK